MVEEEQTWCKPWGRDYFEKVGVQHVDCVGDDGGEVSDSGDITKVMTYLTTCYIR